MRGLVVRLWAVCSVVLGVGVLCLGAGIFFAIGYSLAVLVDSRAKGDVAELVGALAIVPSLPLSFVVARALARLGFWVLTGKARLHDALEAAGQR